MATKKIPTKEAAAGMIVAEPVFDDAGRMLVPADFRLTPLQITCLARWGVAELEVLDEPVSPPSTARTVPGSATTHIPPLQKARAAHSPLETEQQTERQKLLPERLDRQFAAVADAPLMGDLKEAVLRLLSRRNTPLPGQR